MRRILVNVVIVLFCGLNIYSAQIKITDLSGRHISVPKKPARIVCIAPGCLRLIVYMQEQDKLVGIEKIEKQQAHGRPYWLAHPELKKLPVIGPGGISSINQKPQLEPILQVNPEIIFITYLDAEKADEVTKLTGIPVVVLSYGPFGSFDTTLYKSISLLGKIFSNEKRAEDVVNFIENQKKEIACRAVMDKGKTYTAYVGGLGFKGESGLESSSSSFVPFIWAKVDNAVKTRVPEEHITVDKETLLKLNPDYIFVAGGASSLFLEDLNRKNTFYKELKAFKNDSVYILYPFNWYMTNVGTAIIDSYAVGKRLYPEKFKDINLIYKADSIYEFLVGKPIYSKMEQDYGKLGAKIRLNNTQ